MTCHVVSGTFVLCGKPAVFGLEPGPKQFPRCQKHKRSSFHGSLKNIDSHRFKRAVERGMVSYSEMFHRLETEFEQRLKGWHWWNRNTDTGY